MEINHIIISSIAVVGLFLLKYGVQIIAIINLFFSNKLSVQQAKHEALSVQRDFDTYNEGKAEKLVKELQLMSEYIDYLHSFCNEDFLSYTQWIVKRKNDSA